MRQNPSKRLLATAYHEAGHAVAAHKLKVPMSHVAIVSHEDALGLCQLKMPQWVKTSLMNDIANDARTEAWIQKNILMTLAGMKAEKLYTGRNNHVGARFDNESAAGLAAHVCGSDEEAKAYLKWLNIKAQHLIHSPFARVSIESVAQELMKRKTLTSEEVTSIIQHGIQNAINNSVNNPY